MPDNKCVRCGAVIPEGRQVCPNCEFFGAERKVMTNADRIRGMSDEELAEWLYHTACHSCPFECPLDYCPTIWLEWLKSPVEVENETSQAEA